MKEFNKNKEFFYGTPVKKSDFDLIFINQDAFDYFMNEPNQKTYFSNCRFIDVTFNNKHLKQLHFDNSRFYGCTFNGGTFTDCSFKGADFTDCEFISTSINRCNFKNTHLNIVDFYNIKSIDNRNLDSILITKSGAPPHEVDNHRRRVIKSFLPDNYQISVNSEYHIANITTHFSGVDAGYTTGELIEYGEYSYELYFKHHDPNDTKNPDNTLESINNSDRIIDQKVIPLVDEKLREYSMKHGLNNKDLYRTKIRMIVLNRDYTIKYIHTHFSGEKSGYTTADLIEKKRLGFTISFRNYDPNNGPNNSLNSIIYSYELEDNVQVSSWFEESEREYRIKNLRPSDPSIIPLVEEKLRERSITCGHDNQDLYR